MSYIDKQNQLIYFLRDIHNKNENYMLQNNLLLCLKPSKIGEIKDKLELTLYDQENDTTKLPHHIYDVAKTALIRTLVLNKDISIIFNGGSQSGKTFNIYKCLEYFSNCSFNQNNTFNCEVIDSIKLMIKNLCCSDDITEIPLLYKVNVAISGISGIEFKRPFSNAYNKLICFNENVKNFNIFYTIFYGMNENDKEKFCLKNKNFYLLNNIILNDEEKEFCKAQFNKVKYSMLEILGFTEEHFETFLCILCAILNIGNISFYTDTNSDDEIVKICQKPELFNISKLLNVEKSELMNIFDYEKSDNNIEKALNIRDALIEMLYMKLVDWVLMRIENIYDDKGKSSIYLFDYKGYTSSGYNEYDEFCTNITNELHMNLFFSKYMEYYLNNGMVKENITLTKKENESCLSLLIDGKKNLLATLNDESVFPLTSESTLIKKFDLNFIDQNCYLNSRSSKTLEFGIKHFFGVQYYNVSDFLVQNKRVNYTWLNDICLKSQNTTILSMFSNECYEEKPSPFKYIASEIINSLTTNITSNMLSTEMIFVCCLKPSLKKSSREFDCNFITKQLKSQGLLDLLKVETNNFNHQYHTSQFLKEFKTLQPKQLLEKQNDIQNINNILTNQGLKYENDYLIIDNKIYLTENLSKIIEWNKYKRIMKSVIKIQTLYRGYIKRKIFLLKRKAAIKIQSFFRGWKGRQFVSKMKSEVKQKIMDQNLVNNKETYKYIIKSITTSGISLEKIVSDQNLKLEFEEDYEKIAITQDVLPIVQIPIEDFAKKYIKYHTLGVKREVIFAPFLEKDNEIDFSESLKIFNMILEYMTSEDINNSLVRNIIDIGINNTQLRDEIYIQILNQTYNNTSKKEIDRVWILFFVTLNSFLPSPFLFPVLSNYFFSQKQPLQILLSQIFCRHLSVSQLQSFRKYPSTTKYEMIAFSKKQPLCIRININNISVISMQIDSLSTIKEIVKNCLGKINIGNVNGWNVDLEVLKNEILIKLEEKDYLFDIVYMIENDMINKILSEKLTFSTNAKNLKSNKEAPSGITTPLINEKNMVVKNGNITSDNIEKVSNNNSIILSPRTLRRVYIFDCDKSSGNTENENNFDNNNNKNIISSINQFKHDLKTDENGNNMDSFNTSIKSSERGIYSPLRYMPIMEVDDDVEDLIDNIFYDAISEEKDVNLPRTLVEETLVKNIQGGLVKNDNDEITYNNYNEQHLEDKLDFETFSSYNTMSTSKFTSQVDDNSKDENLLMALSKLELQKLIALGQRESSICQSNNLSIMSNDLKSKEAILVSPKLYNLFLRKELFFPCEIPDKYEVDLIYLQIINDCKENNPYRIKKKERDAINKILRYSKMSLHDIDQPEKIPFKVKDDIVNCARKWPLYFSKVYFVEKIDEKGSENYQLHVSENGIYVVEMITKSSLNTCNIIDTIFYDEIADTYFDDNNVFYIYLYNNIHYKFLTTNKSEEIRNLINKFLNPIMEKPIYVHAIAQFLSNNNELLSFDKGDQIQVINDSYYHKSTMPNHGNEWLFGKCHNSIGWFSTEYVSMTYTEDDSYVTPYSNHHQVSFILNHIKVID